MMQLDCDTAALGGDLYFDYPLNECNSWRVGGRSDCFYMPSGVEDFMFFLSHCVGEKPVTCIGLGSNVLVRDGGVRGVMISLRDGFEEISHCGGCVYAQAGVTCARLARYCAEHGLAGLEFIVGIPGVVGGALAMNAGAFGAEIWERVSAIDSVDRSGCMCTHPASRFEVGYRTVEMPGEEWFVAGHFDLLPGADPDELKQRIKELLRQRKKTQPLQQPSCGSVFKNPEGEYAAHLIEQCGLKEYTIGGAQVSVEHANFIINRGNARAAEIEALIRHVQSTVTRETGVKLQMEVRILGEHT